MARYWVLIPSGVLGLASARALLPAVSADMSIRVSDLVTGAGLVGLSSPPPPPPPQLNKKRVKNSERNTFIGLLIDIPLQSLCLI
ncbi:hypothetical protein D3C73_626990 [compost metagenome]